MSPEQNDELVATVARHVVKMSLGKAVRACRRHGVAPGAFPGIVALMNYLLEKGQYQQVLAAFGEAGAAFGGYTEEGLLSALAKDDTQPNAFLKHCYRLGLTSKFPREVERAIQWHRDRGHPPPKPPEPLPPSLATTEFDGEIKPATRRVLPLYTFKPTGSPASEEVDLIKVDDDEDLYIISQTARAKQAWARETHAATLTILRDLLSGRGFNVGFSTWIDLYARKEDWLGIFEVKSIYAENENFQWRHAFSQLHEYRYRHGDDFQNASLWFVFSQEPSSLWWLDIARKQNMNVLWVEDGEIQGPNIPG